MIYMNKPGVDPRYYSLLRDYERFVDLTDPPRETRVYVPPLVRLLGWVANELGVSVEQMKSPRRERNLVLARIVFCRRAIALETYSTPQIGAVINRDHTSVLYFADLLKTKTPEWVERALQDRNIKV